MAKFKNEKAAYVIIIIYIFQQYNFIRKGTLIHFASLMVKKMMKFVSQIGKHAPNSNEHNLITLKNLR